MAEDIADTEMTHDVADGSKTLGLERWVQFGYIAGALAVFWVLEKLIAGTWDLISVRANIAESNPTITTAAAAIAALVTAYVVYRNDRYNKIAHEVAAELARVTWPTRKETWSNTVVVIITSIVAAIILFTFDAAWSAVTDLIY